MKLDVENFSFDRVAGKLAGSAFSSSDQDYIITRFKWWPVFRIPSSPTSNNIQSPFGSNKKGDT